MPQVANAPRKDQKQRDGQHTAAPVAAIPFAAASHHLREPMGRVITVAPGAANVDSGIVSVPATPGFLRHIVLHCKATGGVLGVGPALTADFPFNFINSLQLLDTNGSPIYGPLDGYAVFLSNVFGGYSFISDPRTLVGNTVNDINFDFWIRIPVEILAHNGFGSIRNENASASYQLRVVASSVNSLFTNPPTTLPTITIDGYVESWAQPDDTTKDGIPVQTEPLGHGTTQSWTSNIKVTAAGQNNVQVERVGNVLRSLIFVCRDQSGVRSDGVFPSQALIQWEGQNIFNDPQGLVKLIAQESLAVGNASAGSNLGVPGGVFVYPMNNSVLGKIGDEDPNLWYPTDQGTRLEVQGVSGAAGTMQVLINDIRPIEVRPEARYEFNNASAFHPKV